MTLGLLHIEGRASFLDRIEAPFLDLRFQLAGPKPAPENVLIVALDDRTVAQVGGYPLPRTKLADLIDAVAASGARCAAVDLLFLEASSREGDAALERALRGTCAVIAAAALFGREGTVSDDRLGTALGKASLPVAESVLWPVQTFRDDAVVGLVNIATDSGGTPRHIPLLVRYGEDLLPSFALQAARRAAALEPELEQDAIKIGPVRTSVDLGYSLPIRFHGPRGAVRTVSAADVLDRRAGDEFQGRIAVIGATAIGTSDTFATPFDPVLPGVEVLATAIGQLAGGQGLTRNTATRRVDAAAALTLSVVVVLLLSLRRIGLGMLLATLPVFAWLALTLAAFVYGYWLSIAVPLTATAGAALLYGAARLWLDQVTERHLEAARDSLSRFHPAGLADQLAATPRFLAEPVQQDASVLFVDLSGFTGLSERLGVGPTRDFLKSFHSLVDDHTTRHDGMVLSYMGDGAMMAFGLLEQRSDSAARAVNAALDLVRHIGGWLAEQPLAAGRELGVRVGGHHGPVVVSRLGSDAHQQITATGDTVNVASRLLEVAAKEGASIALSADLLTAAGHCAASGDIGEAFCDERLIPIRGREQPLAVRFAHH